MDQSNKERAEFPCLDIVFTQKPPWTLITLDEGITMATSDLNNH